MKLFLGIVLALLAFGCTADVQRVCPTGDEAVYLEIAAQYWREQGREIEVVYNGQFTSEGCTVNTRISADPPPGFEWGEAWARHKLPKGMLPSATFESILHFKADVWERRDECERIFMAIHELGHIWYRGHYSWMPMVDHVPTSGLCFWVETNVL